MKSNYLILVFLGIVSLSIRVSAQENKNFRFEKLSKRHVEITEKVSGKSFKMEPSFLLIGNQEDPRLHYGFYREDLGAINTVAWERHGEAVIDVFQSGDISSFKNEGFKKTEDGVSWQLSHPKGHQLQVSISINADYPSPLVSYEFTPAVTGYYSISFQGMTAETYAQVDALWQPFVWQEKRFPPESLLSVEEMCPVPATLLYSKGLTVGVMANPEEIPYRLPSMELGEVKFGVAIRNQQGKVQPQIFAPVMGNPDSYLKVGQTYSFSFLLIAHAADIEQTHKHLVTEHLQFKDYRENVHWSLNQTLENMVDYAMNDTHSGWYEELRGFDYSTDVKRSVKIVSSLHPLSLAYIMDNEDIFRRRALPMVEYVLSRERYLFSIFKDVGGQNVSSRMKGPAVEVGELAALYDYSGQQTPIFMHFADSLKNVTRQLNLHKKSLGDSWPNLVALYRSTGNEGYLLQAMAKADKYISERVETIQVDMEDAGLIGESGQFWTDFSPLWMELLDLYELTEKKKYLDAAYQGAKQYLQYIWFHPVIPQDSMIGINPDGTVGFRCYEGVREDMPFMKAPSQKVPAWRVSQIGLTPEACNTFPVNPAILLTSFAPHLLRIAYYKNDDFLRAVARASVIGRYKNYPGYDINGIFNTVYSRPDYPERPLDEISYNQIYYNHVWPQIAMVTDYLVSDTYVQSEGNIYFPSLFAEGYAYLKSKVYGHQPGKFYDYESVNLWMPADMVEISNEQVNQLSAYNQDHLFMAFTNQSDRRVEFEVSLNPDVVPIDSKVDYTAKIWDQNRRADTTELKNGKMKLTIAPKGIIAVAIEGVMIQPYLNPVKQHAQKDSKVTGFTILESPAGKIYGAILDFGNDFPRAYIWSGADQGKLQKLEIQYQLDEQPSQSLVDESFPFEFSLPMNPEKKLVKINVEGVTASGESFKKHFELGE